ncbi:SEC12-like protein 2, partial [Smittium mucronatum]
MTLSLTRSVFPAGFPVSCIDVSSNNDLYIGGGGGPNRSGIKNKIIVVKINEDLKDFTLISQLEFGNDEDAPTCLSLHPKARSFFFSFLFFILLTQPPPSPSFFFLKFITFDPKGFVLCSGSSDGTLSVLNYPSLKPRFPNLKASQDLLSADFSYNSKLLAVVTKLELLVINSNNGTKVQIINEPKTSSGENVVFRSLKFGNSPRTQNRLYTALNSIKKKDSYITVWNTKEWSKVKTKFISNSPITCLCQSFDGDLLAVATANMEIIVMDSFLT